MKRLLFIPVLLILIVSAGAQVLSKSNWKLGPTAPAPSPAGNSITDVVVDGNVVYLGGSGGLSRTADDGQTWEVFNHKDGLGRGDVSAITIWKQTIWVATGFDTLTKDAGLLTAGGGLSYSSDNGQTWTHVNQPGATPVQNITYDIAIQDSVIWIASYGGGLRKSRDWGQTWTPVAPDSFSFDTFAHLNHRAFSVISTGKELWVGTAGGINRSDDGGKTWVNFNHQNQEHPISGNFVVALAYQKTGDRNIIWAATNPAEAPEEFRAVSWTDDDGYTWHTTLKGQFAHNFAFDDSVVYVATDSGLFKSVDGGQSWAHFPPIVDSRTGVPVLTSEVYSVGVAPGHVLWVGTGDGLARTDDNGRTWKVFRRFAALGGQSEDETYAYPNPFSPLRQNILNGAGHVRFHYFLPRSATVSVKIFDFSMDLVRTLISGKQRPVGGEYDEIWDGTNDLGTPVANGVYFYRIERSGLKPVWGKVLIVN